MCVCVCVCGFRIHRWSIVATDKPHTIIIPVKTNEKQFFNFCMLQVDRLYLLSMCFTHFAYNVNKNMCALFFFCFFVYWTWTCIEPLYSVLINTRLLEIGVFVCQFSDSVHYKHMSLLATHTYTISIALWNFPYAFGFTMRPLWLLRMYMLLGWQQNFQLGHGSNLCLMAPCTSSMFLFSICQQWKKSFGVAHFDVCEPSHIGLKIKYPPFVDLIPLELSYTYPKCRRKV